MSESPPPSTAFFEETVVLNHDANNYLTGILTTPVSVSKERPGRVVVVSHGLGGHKDYCYQKLLCRKLAEELGIYSFRFDFRNCGDSSDIIPDIESGERGIRVGDGDVVSRTISRDLEDLDLVIFDYLLLRRKLILTGLIGHSRGAVAIFEWALSRQNRITIPNIVNCSSRYTSWELKERVDQIHPEASKNGGYFLKAYRNGKYPQVWIPYEETMSVSSVDMSKLSTLDPATTVLSVYGLNDEIISLEDAAKFANDLSHRHTLELVSNADHNFYGLDSNSTTKQKLNYNPVVVDLIIKWFSADSERSRFMDIHKYSGLVTRWKNIDGVSNFRDFGGYRTRDSTSVRPGILFRSANLSLVTEKGQASLNQLGVKTVFDLRSESERDRMGAASIPGIDVRWVPVFQKQDSSPEALALRYEHFFDPIRGFEQAYKEILSKAGPGYREIMLHLRDRPNDGIVIHCTAGKDRTGVICALILLFMAVDINTVAREYEMTTYGLRDEIPRIMKAIEHEKKHWKNPNGMLNMLSSKYEAMIGSIAMIEKEFGGVINYFKTYCQLTDDDLSIIKRNLTISESYHGWKWHSTL